MKTKITLTIAAILLATLFASTQTIITTGPVQGTWTLSGSPYEIQGSINVADGTTLTIEAGVIVRFNTPISFKIFGCLIAEGTEQENIQFTNYEQFVKWGGISWINTPSSNDSSKIDYCLFENSFAYGTGTGLNSGGAIRVSNFDKLSIQHSTFSFNRVEQPGNIWPSGGAIALWTSSISITHCIFHNNSADMGGAIMIYNDSEAIIDNCLFFDNNATADGGAIEVYETDTSYFINCTFVNNHAGNVGGAFDTYSSISTLTNCILWGNTADAEGNQVNIYNATAGLNIFLCDIQEGEAGFGGYPNNGVVKMILDTDPEFLGSGYCYPYSIDTSSPCKDYGTLDTLYLPNNWVCPCFDLAGLSRVEDSIDLGCYETHLITGANESNIEQISDMGIYPNPATNNITLTYQVQNTSNINIFLYSITGKKLEILSNQMTPRGEYKHNIDLTSLPVGTYFLKLQTDDEVMTKKVVKL